MKNKILIPALIVAFPLSVSLTFAQESSGNGGTQPKMIVQQVKPVITADGSQKTVVPVDPVPMDANDLTPLHNVKPVTFKPTPPGMHMMLPKEDIKPVMPSTIIKPVTEVVNDKNLQGTNIATLR